MVELNSFICGDCMDYLPQFPDKYFDLSICDPPYGIGASEMTMGKGLNKGWKKGKHWDDSPPPQEYFEELFRVSKKSIIFGGNYFDLPKTRSWIIWDKGLYGKTSFADCEMAWTDIDMSARIIQCRYDGFIGRDEDGRIHPTQKPTNLYEKLLSRFAHPGDKILDTHVGSASSLISCYKNGFDYIGFEKDPHYYELENKRLEEYKSQITLFDLGLERNPGACGK